jgi:acid phosphatase (class A)
MKFNTTTITRFLSSNRLLGPAVFIFAAVAAAPLHAGELNYLPPGKPDAIALLPPPPQPGSPQQAADLAEVVAVHDHCTPREAAVAYSEEDFFVFNFAPEIGPFFQADRLPKTAAFFHRVQKDVKAVEHRAKDYWKRPRPYQADPALANGSPGKSFGYPSGHSMRATVYSLILSQIFPAKRAAIMKEGRAIAWHRVEIARHYPTDIFAGQVLGQAIVSEMNKNPAFQRDLAAVKAEIAAAQKASQN